MNSTNFSLQNLMCITGTFLNIFLGESMFTEDLAVSPPPVSNEEVCRKHPGKLLIINFYISLQSSVGDPDPDPKDPHVFGPPGSGSDFF